LGLLLGTGRWYFSLVPAPNVSLGIDAASYVRASDPTALFAFALPSELDQFLTRPSNLFPAVAGRPCQGAVYGWR
jgi:hypothetical protein